MNLCPNTAACLNAQPVTSKTKCMKSVFSFIGRAEKPIYDYMVRCFIFLAFSVVFPCNLLVENHCYTRSGVFNPAPGELPSCRFQIQPQSNTPEAANQGVQD